MAVASIAIGRAITTMTAATAPTRDPNVTANTALALRQSSPVRTPNALPNRTIATRRTIAATGRTNGTVRTPAARVQHLLLVPKANSSAPTVRRASMKALFATKYPIVQTIAMNHSSVVSTSALRYVTLFD